MGCSLEAAQYEHPRELSIQMIKADLQIISMPENPTWKLGEKQTECIASRQIRILYAHFPDAYPYKGAQKNRNKIPMMFLRENARVAFIPGKVRCY